MFIKFILTSNAMVLINIKINRKGHFALYDLCDHKR